MRTLSLALISLFVSAAASAGELVLPTTAGELQLTDEGQEFVATYNHVEKEDQNLFGNVTVRVPATTGAAFQRVGTEFQLGFHFGKESVWEKIDDHKGSMSDALLIQTRGAGATLEAVSNGEQYAYLAIAGGAELQRGEALADTAALATETRHALAWSFDASSIFVLANGLAVAVSAGGAASDTLVVDEIDICSTDGTTCATQAVFGAGTSTPFSAQTGIALQYTGLKKAKAVQSASATDDTPVSKNYQPGFLVAADLVGLGGAAAFEGAAQFFWSPIVKKGQVAPRTGLGVDVNAPLSSGPVDVIPRVFVGATL